MHLRRERRRSAAFLAAASLLVLTRAGTAEAQAARSTTAAHPARAAEHRLEVSFAASTLSVDFDGVRFGGAGVPEGGMQRRTVSYAGQEVGLRRPTFLGAEFSAGYRHTYFGVLAMATVATGRPDAPPTTPEASATVAVGRVTAYGGGVEAFGAVPLGRVTASLGAAAGLRAFSAPLLGFAPRTCTDSSGRGRYRYPCEETGTTGVVPWVQPRLRVDVTLDRDLSVFLGGFVGVDALSAFSPMGGLLFGLRL